MTGPSVPLDYEKVMTRPSCMTDKPYHYCPGCGHSIVHHLEGEVIDELGIEGKSLLCAPVGCATMIYDYFKLDNFHCLHGRAPAVATGMKLARPDLFVWTHQGDGDLAGIGTTEIIHTAARQINISVIFANNAIYGMTGGQMAPTTVLGQVTTTSQDGRSVERNGFPIRVVELLAALEGPVYLERVSVDTPANIRKTKRAIKKCFENQLAGKGFSLVEVLCQCPTGWKLDPMNASGWVTNEMTKTFPLGVFKDL